jgi:3-hydroxyisobutyrate dehydrogenase-like beta-hydroxyacid dehydrogenase
MSANALPTVAIVSPGQMGAAIGARLRAGGLKVITPAGRSAASEARARTAGIEIVPERDIAASDFIFSIVPPSGAADTARRIAELVRGAPKQPLYIDWNAVSPARAREVAAIVEGAGGRFADGGIIGLPPGPEGPGPLLYTSGPEAAALAALEGRGVRFKIMDGPVGAASALKMGYAGMTKGTIALGAAMLLAASRAGCGEALVAELAASQPQVLAGFRRSIPDMFGKAERWAPELQEIAAFIGHDRSESGVYDGIAAFYAFLAEDMKGERQEIGLLDALLRDG